MTSAAAPDICMYTDRGQWRREIRRFIVNQRPVIRYLGKPAPALILSPDHGLLTLMRAHYRMPDPAEGGDVRVVHRLASDSADRSAKALIKYEWWNPLSYTMTIAVRLPDHLKWLRGMLAADGCWCIAAGHVGRGALWLPAPEGLTEHIFMVASAFSMPRGTR